mgnify:FL=1
MRCRSVQWVEDAAKVVMEALEILVGTAVGGEHLDLLRPRAALEFAKESLLNDRGSAWLLAGTHDAVELGDELIGQPNRDLG